MRSSKNTALGVVVLLLLLLLATAGFLVWRNLQQGRQAAAAPIAQDRQLGATPSPWQLSQSTARPPAPEPAAPPSFPAPPAGVQAPPNSQNLPLEVRAGKVVTTDVSPPSPTGQRRRTSIHQTDFKYPLLRTEEQFTTAADGSEIVLKRRTMVADHLKVRLRNGFTESQLQTWLAQHGLTIRRHIPNTLFYLVAIPNSDIASYDRALKILGDRNGPTAYGEPDYIVGINQEPDPTPPGDARFGEQWALRNTGQSGGTPGSDINVLPAWTTSTGSASVIVAVLDTGIDINHPDLVANLWVNENEVAGDGIDNDNNGYVDDVHGFNFVTGSATPTDGHGHGTHTAGTVGAVGNNDIGISGVAQNVKIMALKFLSDSGSGADSDAIEGIAYATAHGAMLTSNSWGGGDYSLALEEIIQAAGAAGVGCVIAAGNDGTNNDIIPVYPASYDSSNILVVAATDHNDTLAWFSCYGKNTVHLAAPGVDILSTIPGGGYGNNTGTSMATPHVSGAAALLRAANPGMSFADIKSALIAQARPVSSLASKIITGGVLNVGNTMPLATTPYPVMTGSDIDDSGNVPDTLGNDDGILSPGETAAVIITLRNLGGIPASEISGTLALKSENPLITLIQPSATFGTINTGATAKNTAEPYRIAIDSSHPTPAEIPLTLTLADEEDRTWTHDLVLHLYTTSTVSGKVTQLDGTTPIANATITLDGTVPVTTTTNEDGEYTATAVDGTYAVTATATNYIPSDPQTVTVPPSASDIDFSLGFSSLIVSPLQLSATLQEDTTTTQTISLSNEGNQTLTWKFLELLQVTPTTPEPAPTLTSASSVMARHFTPPVSNRTRSIEEGPATPLRVPSKPRTLNNDTATLGRLPLFDGFEDGTYDLWFDGFSFEATREVVTDPVAEGDYSFHFRLDGEDDHLSGIHQEFDYGTRPGYASFRLRTSARDQASGYFVLGDVANGYLVDFIWFFANTNGRFYINDDVGGNQFVAYQPDRWYHIEFRNINWSTRTFDYAVDGVVIQTAVPFRNATTANECAYAFVYNYHHGVESWWDNIIISNDALDWLTITPDSGTLAPEDQTELTATFDANNITAGIYRGTLRLLANDPLKPETLLPVEMIVTPAPNTAPVANSSTISAVEDFNRTIALSGSDAEGQALTARITQLPERGQLYQTSDGINPGTLISQVPMVVTDPLKQVIYVPPPNANGDHYATFQFTMHDGKLASAPATITINLSPRNDPPTVHPDTYSILPGQTLPVLSLLDNDYSADLKTLNISNFTQPSNNKGTLTNNGNNTLSFTPAASFLSGSTTFSYTVSDGNLSTTGNVTIRVGALTQPEWPQFGGGPNRTHHHPAPAATETPLLQLWQHTLSHTPNAPVIGAGLAYFTSHTDGQPEQITAINLNTGNVAWTQTQPSATAVNAPIFNGTQLYFSRTTPNSNAYLTTLTAPTGSVYSSPSYPGISSEIGKHLLFANNRVYLPGGGPGAKLYSVEPGTSYAPFIADLPSTQTATPTAADHLILLATNGTVRALHSTSGFVYWSFKPDPELTQASATGTIAWNAGIAYIILEGKIHAINTLQYPSLAWSSSTAGYLFAPLIAGNRVYAAHDANEIRVYDSRSGTLLDSYPLPETPTQQPLVCQDSLIVPTASGTHLIRLEDGEIVQTLPATGHLTAANHQLLITNPATRVVTAYGSGPVLTFSPPGGSYFNPVSVHVGCTIPEAVIHFTTDGTLPTASSPILVPGTPLHFLRSTQLRALAIHGNQQSPVKTAHYTITDSNNNGIPDWWENQYSVLRPGNPTQLNPTSLDFDNDGFSDMQEFILGTNPNVSDHIELTVSRDATGNTTLTWPSQAGRHYTILSGSNLQSADWHPEPTATSLPGTGSPILWQDPATAPVRKFYRISVSVPQEPMLKK
jgi:subtilisin family serine protease